MKFELGLGEGLWIERLRSVARTVLACSLASFSSLGIALSGFAYITLGNVVKDKRDG